MRILIVEEEGYAYIGPYTQRLNIETILVRTFRPSWGQVADTRYAREVIDLPDTDDVETLVNIATDREVNAVVSTACLEPYNLRDAELKQILEAEYKIPVIANSLTTVATAFDKFRTTALLSEHGIPTSSNGLAHSIGEAMELAESLAYPLVLKKIKGYSGMGLRLFETNRQLERYLRKKIKFPILLERFLEGIEYSVEVLRFNEQSFAQVAIYKGKTTKNIIMHPIYRLQVAPNPITDIVDDELLATAGRAAAVLDVEGSADFDVIVDVGGIKIIEVNPRIGGVTRLSAASTGINTYEKLIDMAVGNWHPDQLKKEQNVVIELPTTKELTQAIIGKLTHYRGIINVRTIDWMPVLPLTGKLLIKAATYNDAVKITSELAELYSDKRYIDELMQVIPGIG